MNPMTEKILQAAIDVLNEKGIYYLSMREIAKRMNIKAATLYYHISRRQEIYNMISEYICGKMSYPEKIKDAKLFLIELNGNFRQELLKVRGSAEIFGETVPDTPGHLEFIKKTIEILSILGVKEESCFSAANMLINYVLCFVMDEVYFKSVSRGKSQSMGTEFYRKNAAGMDYDRQFLYGLEVIVDGLKKNKQ